MAVFHTPLIDHLLTPYYSGTSSSSAYYHNHWTQPSTSYTPPTMPPSKAEAKSAIQAQFPPGSAPPGTTTGIPEPTINLLESTPPQIVRALAQAEPLIRGLNFVLSLVTWTSQNDWLSFFLVVGWWILCLYGSFLIKFAGNFLPALGILAYYAVQKSGISIRFWSLLDSRDTGRENFVAFFPDADVERNRHVAYTDQFIPYSPESLGSLYRSPRLTTSLNPSRCWMAHMASHHS
jgi:hypothetical protein